MLRAVVRCLHRILRSIGLLPQTNHPPEREPARPAQSGLPDPETHLRHLLSARAWDEAVAYTASLAATDPDLSVSLCTGILIHSLEYRPDAYSVPANALRSSGHQQAADRITAEVLSRGLGLVSDGKLADGARFLEALAPAFSDRCEAYALLYGTINRQTEIYRAQQAPPRRAGERRKLIIALTVWGDRYVHFMTNYFFPSILSANNVPLLSTIRDVQVDLYTTPQHVDAIRSAPSYQALSRFAKIDIIEFSERIIKSAEYSRNPNLRYMIYGGFHHAAIEHARSIRADIICIAPDGVHSDGSFTNYARFVDKGYKAVLFTSTRCQAETILPIFDRMRDPTSQSLTLPPRELVAIGAQNIHHDFQRYLMVKENRHVPEILTLMLFPQPHGFYMRCLHIHPIIVAAEALERPIAFDYGTVDSTFMTRMFPDPADWQSIKVIDDSDDGMMMDLTDAFAMQTYPERAFALQHLIDQLPHFKSNHFWNFGHRIDYHSDDTFETIGTFDLTDDGRLKPKAVPVASVIMSDTAVAEWFQAHRPKAATARS